MPGADAPKPGNRSEKRGETLLKSDRKPMRFLKGSLQEIKRHKAVATVYFILRFAVIAIAVLSCLDRNFENLFVCVLVLVLFLLPAFIQRRLNIELPSTLEIIILCFIFAAEILGELRNYFIQYPNWDTMLHTLSGFLLAAVGFSMVDILNRNKPESFNLSPIYLAMAAFCFSMTAGVLWEFFEFAMDRLFHMDMQKDTILHVVSSVALDPTNQNIPITVSGIRDVAVNGRSLGLGGYLDIGLYDTMEDLFVNFIGAVVFSAIGFFYVKNQRNHKRDASQMVVSQFVPRRRVPDPDALPEIDDAPGLPET